MRLPRPRRPTAKRPTPRRACATCATLVDRTALDPDSRCESCVRQLELPIDDPEAARFQRDRRLADALAMHHADVLADALAMHHADVLADEIETYLGGFAD
jgi:hypothetical protein